MGFYMLPRYVMRCDQRDPMCFSELEFGGWSEEKDKPMTAALARELAKEQGWQIAPVRIPGLKKVFGWDVHCPDHKEG